MAIQEPDTCKHKLFENIHVVFLKSTSRIREELLENRAIEKTIDKRIHGRDKIVSDNTVFFATQARLVCNRHNNNFCLTKFCHHTVHCRRGNGNPEDENNWKRKYVGRYRPWHIYGKSQHYEDAYGCDCGNNHTKIMEKLLRCVIYENIFIT